MFFIETKITISADIRKHNHMKKYFFLISHPGMMDI